MVQSKKSNTILTGGGSHGDHAGQIHDHGAHRPKGADRDPEGGARDVWLAPGDSLILLATASAASRCRARYYDSFVRAVFDQGAQAAAPDVPEAETKVFASALERELKKGDGK